MRRVKVITGLKIEERFAGDHVEVWKQVFYPPYPTRIQGTDDFLVSDFPIEREIIPVLTFCKTGKPDVFVAYSSEVEELLGVPIRKLSKENAGLHDVVLRTKAKVNEHARAANKWHSFFTASEDKLRGYMYMTFWQRIKFLFGVHPE